MVQGYCNGCKIEKELPRTTSKYCSRDCWKNNWKPYNADTNSSGMSNKKHSIKSKQKMSNSALGVHIGKLNGQWKGGRQIQLNGYTTIHINGKRVYEHKVVMEKYLRRILSSEECIHHIDGNKTNNNIKNLYLFNSSSEHTKYHHIVRQGIIDELKENGYNSKYGFRGLS